MIQNWQSHSKIQLFQGTQVKNNLKLFSIKFGYSEKTTKIWPIVHSFFDYYLQGISYWSVANKSALRVRRIHNFIELWCLVGSGGLEIWVLSTSFQKSNIGWPQQPLTERVLKFDMNFHDSTETFFFQKIKVKPNLRTWMTLKSSVVNFQALFQAIHFNMRYPVLINSF